MKDPITVIKSIKIEKTISVKIDILNHEEIVTHHKGKFFGTLINWIAPGKAKREIHDLVVKDLNDNLKSRLEEGIDAELSCRLCEEVSKKVIEELGRNKIKAAVITEMK